MSTTRVRPNGSARLLPCASNPLAPWSLLRDALYREMAPRRRDMIIECDAVRMKIPIQEDHVRTCCLAKYFSSPKDMSSM